MILDQKLSGIREFNQGADSLNHSINLFKNARWDEFKVRR